MVARHPWAIVVVSVIGAAVVALVLLNVRSPGTPSAVSASQSPPAASSLEQTPAPTPSPESASPSGSTAPTDPPPDPNEAVTAAKTVLAAFIRESQKDLATPEDPDPGLERYASGAALEEVQAQAGEFVDLESRISGSSRVVSMNPVRVEVDSTPARVTLSTCLDDVDVVLISPESPEGVSGGGRVLNTYVVELSDGLWKVVEHTYPDRTEC